MPHTVCLVAGIVLHIRHPWSLSERPFRLQLVGVALVTVGAIVIAWSVRTVGEVCIDDPSSLVRTGPYALSRNPMYVAWTTLYAGLGFLLNSVWLFVGLPGVLALTHRSIKREERILEDRFRDELHSYRRDVRRYL